MDFRVTQPGKPRMSTASQSGLRVVRMALQAEELAERCAPQYQRLYALRRRIATAMMGIAACLLLVHVVFGANGMVVYRQKRAEAQELREKTEKFRLQNELLERQNADLRDKNSPAVEREAREHLHYARPGEFVYVPPAPVPNPEERQARHSAKK